MSTLSDKLKSLGVQLGTKNITPAIKKDPSIGDITGGYSLETIHGAAFVIDTLTKDIENTASLINESNILSGLAKWINNPNINELRYDQLGYVDIETTGLSGGSGTLAFLVGCGRFEGDSFLVRQFFLDDPAEELAQLTAFEEFISPCRALVTFNGKSFDAPIINSRFTLHGWRSPLYELIHIDLLHLARRLWPHRIPSRTLGNLEVQILNTSRTEEDIPGWMIPQIYMDYLYTGNAYPLKRVFYHNYQDVFTLTKLFNHTSQLLYNPLSKVFEYGADLIALAKIFENMGDTNLAADLFFQGLDFELSEEIMLEAIHRLSLIQKRRNNFQDAIDLWKRATHYHYLEAYIELAKYYEHHVQDYSSALYWTESAIEIVLANPQSYKKEILDALIHRAKRITRLMNI